MSESNTVMHDSLCEEAADANFLRAECRCKERALAADRDRLRKKTDYYHNAYLRLRSDNGRLRGLLREARVKLTADASVRAKTGFAKNLIVRIDAALGTADQPETVSAPLEGK